MTNHLLNGHGNKSGRTSSQNIRTVLSKLKRHVNVKLKGDPE